MTIQRRLVVAAQHNQLARLATFVAIAASEAGFDEQQVNRIELAVDEACTNIIDHAYSGEPGMIELDVMVDIGHALTIVLYDHGAPFEPEQVPQFTPCESLDEVKIGGLGMHLMRQAMDDVVYECDLSGGGNRLTMVKRL
jgi:anti-sigma regulatory factor (Ser/Thr protein kinase)